MEVFYSLGSGKLWAMDPVCKEDFKIHCTENYTVRSGLEVKQELVRTVVNKIMEL